MKSLVKKLKHIRDILITCSDKVYHYDAPKGLQKYIVWAEDGEGNPLELDNNKLERVITGTIDLFTKNEYDELIDKIQDALNKNCISFNLNSVQYEDETGYIHYEWRFEI